MHKIGGESELISALMRLPDKLVVDVGCGLGAMSRWMAQEGATVFALDDMEMIIRARQHPSPGVHWLIAKGHCLPLRAESAHAMVYFASLHHMQEAFMNVAMNECSRVLKKKGVAVFVESVAVEKSYYDLVEKSAEAEESQGRAYSAIRHGEHFGLQPIMEEFFSLESSMADFRTLLKEQLPGTERRERLMAATSDRVGSLPQVAEEEETPLFPSICRVNILQKLG